MRQTNVRPNSFIRTGMLFLLLLALGLSEAKAGIGQTEPLTEIGDNIKSRRAPKHRISADYGYGWAISNMKSSSSNKDNPDGSSFKVEYSYVLKNGIGFGLQYSGFKSSSFDMNLSYIAPVFAWRSQHNHWLCEFDAGIGVVIYDTETYHTCGFGYNISLGAEYMVTKHIGLGASLNAVAMRMNEEKGVKNNNNNKGVVYHPSLLAGVRFYF